MREKSDRPGTGEQHVPRSKHNAAAPLADFCTAAYIGRGQTILLERERIKKQTIEKRRLLHAKVAA